jgi:ABC-type transporter Mla subunit MlaD
MNRKSKSFKSILRSLKKSLKKILKRKRSLKRSFGAAPRNQMSRQDALRTVREALQNRDINSIRSVLNNINPDTRQIILDMVIRSNFHEYVSDGDLDSVRFLIDNGLITLDQNLYIMSIDNAGDNEAMIEYLNNVFNN